jgi:hypothetical protein
MVMTPKDILTGEKQMTKQEMAEKSKALYDQLKPDK